MAEVSYRLAMPEPHTHLFSVEVQLGGTKGPVDLVMPSWTPGSYLLREFPRHVQQFEAEDGSGLPLPWHKRDKNTWRVDANGPELRARYRVYANELTVRTSHLDASHGYVNGASVFMYPADRRNEPASVEIEAPPGWQATTGLTAERSGRFRAANYDELVDCPIEIGTHELIEWEIEGRPHRYAIWGRGNYDRERLIEDTRRIVLACQKLFGSLPYEHFTFVVHLIPGGAGGLEHRNSTSLQADRWTFRGKEYEQFLALVAHEFFHLWNGQRIRPEPLAPVDYTRENYTRSLWVVEGLTTYYTDLILRRAGIMSPERYLERLGEAINRLQTHPGRRVQTLADSSFDSWIKFYRPDEHTPNAQVSYYQKGALVGLLLDLRIRAATENQGSLDDVMRRLWEQYGARDIAVPEAGEGSFEAVAAEVCGEDLTPFFDRYIRGVEELDYDWHLAAAGLRLVPAATGTPVGKPASPGRVAAEPVLSAPGTGTFLGARLKESAGRPVVTHVLADTPAYRAGLNAGDEILALNGLRVRSASLAPHLDEVRPGGRLTLTLFRRDELTSIEVVADAEVEPRLQITPLPHPTALQEATFRGWLEVKTEAVRAAAG